MLPCQTQHLLHLLDERHPKTSTLCDLDKLLEEEGKLFAHCSFLLHNTPCQSLQILHVHFQNQGLDMEAKTNTLIEQCCDIFDMLCCQPPHSPQMGRNYLTWANWGEENFPL